MGAFPSQNVEYRLRVLANDALLSVEERFFQGTVCNVVVPDVSLVVFFDQVVDILFAQYPSVSINVGLVNGWG
jgi:hypothetical protein